MHIAEHRTKVNLLEVSIVVQTRKERKDKTLGADEGTLIVFPILTQFSEFAARATGLDVLILSSHVIKQ